mmetsp:Transcript_28873/g.56463  ORF Transcript_28873/g.56463 Transcript_28873/m.56463 type:complete len:110 (-) Transcript_28873:1368-1697(-)
MMTKPCTILRYQRNSCSKLSVISDADADHQIGVKSRRHQIVGAHATPTPKRHANDAHLDLPQISGNKFSISMTQSARRLMSHKNTDVGNLHAPSFLGVLSPVKDFKAML